MIWISVNRNRERVCWTASKDSGSNGGDFKIQDSVTFAMADRCCEDAKWLDQTAKKCEGYHQNFKRKVQKAIVDEKLLQQVNVGAQTGKCNYYPITLISVCLFVIFNY